MSDNTAMQKSLSSSLKLPEGGMEAACYQFNSFCEVKTASLKTAWMRFLSSDLDRRQATGNYTHFLYNRVNYQIAQFHNSISLSHSLEKTPGVPVWAYTGFFCAMEANFRVGVFL